MPTLEQIQAKIKKLQAQADALIAKESATVVKTIHELTEKHGLTTADIDGHVGGKPRAKRAGAKTVVKGSTATVRYRDPKTGVTWSGHGRAPSWIATAKNRDKFLVDASAATVKPLLRARSWFSVNKASKLAGQSTGKGQPKGPQPALCRDPKSGGTWSGRGRAPAWLASVKDRKKFLIG
jgi:DNA-binding protein H-NS